MCRVQLLDRIMTNVSYEAVLELDPELRQRWLAFNTKETPFDLQKQMDILTLRIAFGKLALDALQLDIELGQKQYGTLPAGQKGRPPVVPESFHVLVVGK